MQSSKRLMILTSTFLYRSIEIEDKKRKRNRPGFELECDKVTDFEPMQRQKVGIQGIVVGRRNAMKCQTCFYTR